MSNNFSKREARKAFLTATAKKINKRLYPNALNNNTVQGLLSSNNFPIADLLVSIYRRRLVELSRNEVLNSPVIYGWLKIQTSNIISSTGFTHRSKVKNLNGKSDKKMRKKIDALWDDFNQQTVTNSGQTLTQVCSEACSFWQMDGECFTRMIRRNDKLFLEILDPNRFGGNISNESASNNSIDIGIKYDKWGFPVEYQSYYGVVNAQNFKAEEIIHLFTRVFPEQKRGLPNNLSAIDMSIKMREFLQTTLLAAKEGAKTKGVLTSEGEHEVGSALKAEIEEYGNLSADEKNDFDDSASLVTKEQMDAYIADMDDESSADEVDEFDLLNIPTNKKYTHTQTKYPDAAILPFTQTSGRIMASGLGVSHPVLFNDYQGLSFSSGKLGQFANQGGWKIDQMNFAQLFLMRVKKEFISMCIENGSIKASLSDVDRLSACDFVGHRWEDLNALATIKRIIMQLEVGLISWQQAANELDRSPQELAELIIEDKSTFDEMGLDYPFKQAIEDAGGYMNDETKGTISKEPKK